MVDANMRRMHWKEAKPELERPTPVEETQYSGRTFEWLESIYPVGRPFPPLLRPRRAITDL